MQQITNTILLIRPQNVRANEQTSTSNYYQKEPRGITAKAIQEKATAEFDNFVEKLDLAGVKTLVFEPKDGLDTPDAHFPNNWISFHENRTVALYPMFARNRRIERRQKVLEFVKEHGYRINTVVDYSISEEDYLFLEGTGSLVLDRVNKKAYCALSIRADEELVYSFCSDFNYKPITFSANQTVDGTREAIYHTNVMMCLAENYAVICSSAIDDERERTFVLKELQSDNKTIIDITEKQVEHFAGNLLQVIGKNQERFLVMSTSAYKAFTKAQIQTLEQYNKIIHAPLDMIETCGGGSARCMMAEVFLEAN